VNLQRNDQMLAALQALGRQLTSLASRLRRQNEAGAAHDAEECLEALNRIANDLQRQERPIKTSPFCLDFGGMRFNGGFGELNYLEALFIGLQGLRTAPDKDAALAKILEGLSEYPPQRGTTFRKRGKYSGSGSRGLVGRL
jgi:hypothetical protein